MLILARSSLDPLCSLVQDTRSYTAPREWRQSGLKSGQSLFEPPEMLIHHILRMDSAPKLFRWERPTPLLLSRPSSHHAREGDGCRCRCSARHKGGFHSLVNYPSTVQRWLSACSKLKEGHDNRSIRRTRGMVASRDGYQRHTFVQTFVASTWLLSLFSPCSLLFAQPSLQTLGSSASPLVTRFSTSLPVTLSLSVPPRTPVPPLPPLSSPEPEFYTSRCVSRSAPSHSSSSPEPPPQTPLIPTSSCELPRLALSPSQSHSPPVE